MVGGSVLEIPGGSHIGVIPDPDGLIATVKINMESTRLIEACLWYVKKTFLCNLGTLLIER